jgi:CubicO group peptidase (beta-lactamase class C family)
MKRALPAALSLLLCLPPLPTESALRPSRSDRDRLHRLEKQFETLRKTLGIPGMSAAVSRKGKVIWAKGFGLADMARRRPARPDTLYRAASLTKTATAVIALQLVEEGLLTLERPVPLEDGRVAPLWSLLSHTWIGPFGDMFQYNDRGFTLTASVLEILTERPIKELFQERVFRRAGLKALAGDDDPTLPALAKMASFYSYSPIRREYGPPGRANRFNGASGMILSVEDLLRYSRAMDEGKLLSSASLETMWTPRRASGGAWLPYGLGWYVERLDGRRIVWHYGLIPDVSSALIVKLPEEGLTLALLANSDGATAPFHPALTGGLSVACPFAADFFRIFVQEPAAGKRWEDPDWSRGAAGVPPPAEGHDFFQEGLAAALLDEWRSGSSPCVTYAPVGDDAADHPDPHPTLCDCGGQRR